MLDMDMVNRTIDELENSDTTFTNCERLAWLYIVKQHHERVGNLTVEDESPGASGLVKKELSDIFPYYEKYCGIKREFQLHRTEKEEVLTALTAVCQEIREFLDTLYNSTDIPEERHLIVRKLSNIEF